MLEDMKCTYNVTLWHVRTLSVKILRWKSRIWHHITSLDS